MYRRITVSFVELCMIGWNFSARPRDSNDHL